MRTHLKSGSFRAWRTRVNGRKPSTSRYVQLMSAEATARRNTNSAIVKVQKYAVFISGMFLLSKNQTGRFRVNL
jgi:hypothetical protein